MDTTSNSPTSEAESGVSRNCTNVPAADSNAYEGHPEPCKEQVTKRKRSHYRESWSSGARERGTSNSRRRENLREETHAYKYAQPHHNAYSHSSTGDTPYINSTLNNVGMMPMVPYAQIGAVSSQWGMNSVYTMNSGMHLNAAGSIGMNPSMDMSANSAGVNPYGYMGMVGDQNLYGMSGNYAPYSMFGAENCIPRTMNREVVRLSKCILYPPSQGVPNPDTRPKPLGCKAVFVDGLPDNATEEIIKEIFGYCGEISVIRMNKKNFCFIKFASENSVDSAITISGYRIKIDNKDDAANTGRLRVDYAQERDDQYEYECRMRSMQREARHREKLEQESSRPPTPPPVAHYSDHEATILGEKLRSEETFQQAVFVLITWLERGECNKRNAGYFYSMIQSTNSHVHRLMSEKSKYEDELNKAELMMKQQMQKILVQFNEIAKVFNAASLKKVWDHFTKAQRKNIELWKKETEETKNAHVKEVLNARIEDEMDVSDDEGDASKQMDGDEVTVLHQFGIKKNPLEEELAELRREKESLRSRLKAAENELHLERSERKQEKLSSDELANRLRHNIEEGMATLLEKRDANDGKDVMISKIRNKEDNEKVCGESSHEQDSTSCMNDLNETELRRERENLQGDAEMISLISSFLPVHPFGASIDYICSFLQQVDGTIQARDVEALMKRYPVIFKEESTGIGASLEKKWTFCGF